MKKFLKMILVSAALVGLAVPSVIAADGKALYTSKGCATCHGKDGHAKMPGYPSLNGQNAKYLTDQIMGIKDGKRGFGPQTKAMAANPGVKSLTIKEAKAISKYLSKVK